VDWQDTDFRIDEDTSKPLILVWFIVPKSATAAASQYGGLRNHHTSSNISLASNHGGPQADEIARETTTRAFPLQAEALQRVDRRASPFCSLNDHSYREDQKISIFGPRVHPSLSIRA
jgi:hypothetical protein